MENDRVSLEDLTQGQWLELRYQMEPRNFKRLVERARNAGIDVPACVGVKNYAPKIKFSTLSETARYVRSQDIEAVKTFNRRCENWSIFVTAELRSQARMSFPHNPKRSKGATPLSESINGNVRYDKKYKVEVAPWASPSPGMASCCITGRQADTEDISAASGGIVSGTYAPLIPPVLARWGRGTVRRCTGSIRCFANIFPPWRISPPNTVWTCL